jgi:hypothetical protein
LPHSPQKGSGFFGAGKGPELIAYLELRRAGDEDVMEGKGYAMFYYSSSEDVYKQNGFLLKVIIDFLV